jgi:hypothetical protein
MIRVITITCEKAENEKKPYTKRLLPDFLLPKRVIRSDMVLKAIEIAGEPEDLEKACTILGCIDLRTAKNSLKNGTKAINKACLSLEEKLVSHSGNLKREPVRPDTPLLSVFSTLVKSFNSLQVLIQGSTGYDLQNTVYSLLGSYWPKTKPTTYVCDSDFSPDTS